MTEQQALPSDPTADSSPALDDLWRTEIHARVAGYRHRSGRHVMGAFSMRFPFPPAEAEEGPAVPEEEVAEAGSVSSVVEDGGALSDPVAGLAGSAEPFPVLTQAIASEPPEAGMTVAVPAADAGSCLPDIAAEPDPPLAPTPVARPQGRRKVIAFPRPASVPAETFHRLADPVVPEQLRILDVPEELEAFPTTRLLDGMELPLSAQHAVVAPTDHIELPFQAVGLSRRLYAGLIDCAVVAAAAGVFGAVCYKMLPKLAIGKPVLIAIAAVPMLLWAAYHYVFTMYGGGTPGMRMLNMRLRTFRGGHLSWRHRRSRVIGLYFSTASLMMGLLWALVDVDALCWHDRISRTYLTKRE
jgi:uncharacterized RDD family membrane protein YckC